MQTVHDEAVQLNELDLRSCDQVAPLSADHVSFFWLMNLCDGHTQAAFPAGRPHAATDAVERWLDAKGFGRAAPDAPASLDERLWVRCTACLTTSCGETRCWLPCPA